MLSKWLTQQVRQPSIYKFPVIDVTELSIPDDGVMDYLGLALLLAHVNPHQLIDQCKLLLKDAEDNSLNKLKEYLEGHI